MKDSFSFMALCAIGAEKILSSEIKKLSESSPERFTIEDSRAGRVCFSATPEGVYYALMGLRTADRVLMRCARYRAGNFDELFEGTQNSCARDVIPVETGVVIEKVRASGSVLSAETSIQAVVHKAVAQSICDAHGITRLPESKNPARFRVYLEKNIAELMLDICGEALSKRGYRTEGGAAPLRETTAAAIVLNSFWKRKYPLYDPYCGSGTIALEAALYAHNIAPGLARNFALDDFLIADSAARDRAVEFYTDSVERERIIRINGSDEDPALIGAAKRNAERACERYRLKERLSVNFNVRDALSARAFDDGAYVITNPPYGIRLGDKTAAEKNYAAMPVIAENFKASRLVVLCDHPGFESFFGSKAAKCAEYRSGALQLYTYEFHYDSRADVTDIKQKNTKREKTTKWTW